ncbi:MAG: putative toxin-antitoxin system toxin component, PIN family [Verrucomicrobiota bacterium]
MVVIDTNLWVSYALIAESVLGQQIKQLIEDQPYAFSEATFIELTDVMMRDKFERFISSEKRSDLLRMIAAGAEWFQPTETITDCRDAHDNKFLELALAAEASFLVTGDEDLLTLNPYRGIRICKISEIELPNKSS